MSARSSAVFPLPGMSVVRCFSSVFPVCLVFLPLAFAANPSSATESVETGGDVILFPAGLDKVRELTRMRAQIEEVERSWEKEKRHLLALLELTQAQGSELAARLEEMNELVARLEAAWEKMRDEELRAAALEAVLSDAFDDWLGMLRPLIAQTSQDLRRELLLELEAFDRRSHEGTRRPYSIQTMTIAGILARLNRFQGTVTPVVEDWTLADGSTGTAQVIYFGLGASLYQVMATGETGWSLFRDGAWVRLPLDGARSEFAGYWRALHEGRGEGVFLFPLQLTER